MCTHEWPINLVKPTLSKASVFTKECPNCKSISLLKAATAGGSKCLIKVLDVEVTQKGKTIFQERLKKAQEENEQTGNDVIQSNGK